MADIVPRHVRSRMMSSIRSRDTKPEMKLRKALHARGFRYRLHDARLPGKPDLVFPRYHAVLFVHGCFWHRHGGCKYATIPSSNVGFWRTKLEKNVVRDGRVIEALRADGWRVGIVWECLFKKPDFEDAISAIATFLVSADDNFEEWPPAL